jgi:hypothetical protein
MTEMEVTELFEEEIAVGEPFSLTLRGACGALADWIARNWEQLSPDDRDELITIGAVVLRVSVQLTRERDASH